MQQSISEIKSVYREETHYAWPVKNLTHPPLCDLFIFSFSDSGAWMYPAWICFIQ